MPTKLIKKRTNFWAASLLSLRLVVGLVMQKLVAIKFGPAGTALFSHFQNLLAIFIQPVQDIIGQGLISGYSNKAFQKKYVLLGNALLLSFLLTLGLSLLVFIFGQKLLLFFNFSFNQWLALLFSILMLSIQLLIANYFIARRKIRLLVILFSGQWLLILFVLFYFQLSTTTFLYNYTLLQAAFTVFYIIIVLMQYPEVRRINFIPNKAVVHHFQQYLYIGFVVLASTKITDYFIRNYAIEVFGITETGFWQAATRISDAYRGLFISFLMLTAYPVFAALNEPMALALNLKKLLKKTLLMALPFLVVCAFFAPFIMQIAYSKDFMPAVDLFRLQLVADIFALMGFPLAILLLAKVETSKYVIAEICSAVIYILIALLGKANSISLLLYAQIIRFVIYLMVVILFTKKYWKID